MNKRYSEIEIKKWYESLPWLRGSNFLPSNVINRLDMYQSYKSDEHLRVSDIELDLHEKIGFNTVRLWLDFDCYYLEKEKYLEILEEYISLCDKHHQLVMLVLAHEEDLPYDTFKAKELGEQRKYYNHFNRDYPQYYEMAPRKKHYLEFDETRDLFLEMIDVVVNKYKNDKRIIAWNIYNEPGITIGNRAIPLLELLFDKVRKINPIQPLSADIWRDVDENGIPYSPEERKALELSDFISFHSYNKYPSFTKKIEALEKHNRPIIVTEWLQRINHNNVEDIYPYLAKKRIGAYCWGFVEGDTFTNEPWENLWKEIEINPNYDYDFSKWQHNLFRRNLHPYIPKEIELIKKINEKVA